VVSLNVSHLDRLATFLPTFADVLLEESLMRAFVATGCDDRDVLGAATVPFARFHAPASIPYPLKPKDRCGTLVSVIDWLFLPDIPTSLGGSSTTMEVLL
jgi:hypothetical protein